MYEVSISKGHLMAMRVAIALLLILVIVLFLRLKDEPRIPPDFGEVQRILDKETSIGLAIIDITGKVTPFDRKLRLVESCGQSPPNQDTTYPASCRPKDGSTLLFKNDVNLLSFGKDKDNVIDVFLTTGDPKTFPMSPCSDGGPWPC